MPGQDSSLPPRQPRRNVTAGSSSPGKSTRRKRPKGSGLPIGMLLGGAFAACLVVAGGVVLFQKFGSAAGIRVSSADLGLSGVVGDSPKAILGDFLDVIDDLSATSKSVTDAESAQKAVAKLAKLEERLVEIQRRAVLVEPVPKEEMKAIEDSFGKPVSAESFNQEAERLKDAGLVDGEFAYAMRSLGFRMMSTVNVLKDGMEALPEPKNEFETLACDYVELGRQRARILARIRSISDVPAAVEQYRKLITEIEALIDRKVEMGMGRQSMIAFAQGRYQAYDTGAAVNELESILSDQILSSPDFVGVRGEVSTAMSNYEFALMAGGAIGRNSRSSDVHTSETQIPGHRPPGMSPGFHHGPGPGGSAMTGGPPRGFGPPGRPGGGQPIPSGSGSIVVILERGPFVDFGNPSDPGFQEGIAKRMQAQKHFGAQLKAFAKSNSRSSTIVRETSRNTIAYKGDVQELADKIDFGVVTDVDVATRTITVDMSNVEFEPEQPALEPAKPATSSSGGFDL